MADLTAAGTSIRAITPARSIGWALLAAMALTWFWFAYGYIEDDAFIHLEFARSVANGKGFAFNGILTNGDTSPLWVLVLAAIHSLGIDWLVGAKIACIIGVVLAISGVWRLAGDLPLAGPGQAWLPAAAVAATALNPYFAHWSFSGMEPVAALGLSLWAIWAVSLGELTAQRCILAAFLLAIAPLLRPELLVFDALAAPTLLWRWWSANRHRSLTYSVATVAGLCVIIALPLVVWSLYAWLAFGSIVPNTNIAKRGGAIGEVALRIASVYSIGFPVAVLLFPFALYGVARKRASGALWILFLWPAACVIFYLANHTLVQTRYALLSAPCMTLGVLWWVGSFGKPRLVAGAAAAAASAGIAVIMWVVTLHIANKEISRPVTTSVAMFIRDRIPPEAPVAVFAIGQLAFESHHVLVDTGGITQPGVAPYLGQPEATLRWAKQHGAGYFVGGELPPEPGAARVFATRVPYVGWTFDRSLYRTTRELVIYRLP